MSKPDSPCRGCEAPKRHSGCHGECEEFIAWKEEYEQRKEEILKQKNRQLMLDDVRHKSAQKMMRKYGMKGKDKAW